MPKELRMNVEFTHPETGELQPAILLPTWGSIQGGSPPSSTKSWPGYVGTHQGETRTKNALWRTGNVPH